MQEAWRAYLELALGMTEASRKKAKKVAKKLAESSGVTVEQIQGLTADLVETSRANREALAKLVRTEVDRAASVVGLARAEEVDDLNARIRDLEQQLRDAQAAAAAPVKKAAAKKATAKKAAAKKATAKNATGKKTAAKKAVKNTTKKAAAKTTKAATASKTATRSKASTTSKKASQATQAAPTTPEFTAPGPGPS